MRTLVQKRSTGFNSIAPAFSRALCGVKWDVHSAGKPWSIQAADRSKNQYRFEVRDGDFWAQDSALDRNRSELSCDEHYGFGRDVWIGFWMLVEPGPAIESSYFVVGQLHQTEDPGEQSVSPPLSLNIDRRDQSLYLETRSSTEDLLVSFPLPQVRWRDTSFERGRWHYFLQRFRYHPTNGHMSLWVNGDLKFGGDIPLGYVDAIGPYYKLGIYRGLASSTQVVRYSDIEIGYSDLSHRISDPPRLIA